MFLSIPFRIKNHARIPTLGQERKTTPPPAARGPRQLRFCRLSAATDNGGEDPGVSRRLRPESVFFQSDRRGSARRGNPQIRRSQPPLTPSPPTIRTPEVHREDPPRPRRQLTSARRRHVPTSGDGWSRAEVGRRGGGGARGQPRQCRVGGRRQSDYGSGLGSALCEQRSLRRFPAPRRTKASLDS